MKTSIRNTTRTRKTTAKPVKRPARRHMSRTRRLTGIGLIALALLLFIGGGWQAYSYVHATAQFEAAKKAALAHQVQVPVQSVALAPDAISGTPVKIDIPSVGISQPVAKGEYDASSGEWTLGYHAVYWASMTPVVNSQAGNTFIYGHDVPQIFGNLLNAQTGAKAIIHTDNGHTFTYTLSSSQAVSPTDVSLIQPTTTPVLTVQTCSGSWYQYRQMFTFKLDGYV